MSILAKIQEMEAAIHNFGSTGLLPILSELKTLLGVATDVLDVVAPTSGAGAIIEAASAVVDTIDNSVQNVAVAPDAAVSAQ